MMRVRSMRCVCGRSPTKGRARRGDGLGKGSSMRAAGAHARMNEQGPDVWSYSRASIEWLPRSVDVGVPTMTSTETRCGAPVQLVREDRGGSRCYWCAAVTDDAQALAGRVENMTGGVLIRPFTTSVAVVEGTGSTVDTPGWVLAPALLNEAERSGSRHGYIVGHSRSSGPSCRTKWFTR